MGVYMMTTTQISFRAESRGIVGAFVFSHDIFCFSWSYFFISLGFFFFYKLMANCFHALRGQTDPLNMQSVEAFLPWPLCLSLLHGTCLFPVLLHAFHHYSSVFSLGVHRRFSKEYPLTAFGEKVFEKLLFINPLGYHFAG